MDCTCGSGLRSVRCCALDPAALAGEAAERPLLPLLREAQAAADPGRAAAACIEILELAPGQREALWLLATLRRADGHKAAAEALLRRLVWLDPNHVAATHALGLALIERGAAGEAEIHARNAVRIAPQQPQSHNLLALAVTEAGQPRTGETHYRRALSLLGSRDPIVLANLAWSLKLQGRMQEARALYAETTSLAPGMFQSWLGYARLEEADRQFETAGAHLDRAETLRPEDANVRLLRAVLQDRMGDAAAALATLEALPGPGALGVEEWLQKGRLLDRLGRYAEAFAAFGEGKALLRRLSGLSYQEDAAAALAKRLRGFCTRRRLATLPRAPQRGEVPLPLFILGFPRSGTTLTEQMLSAHGSIAAGGELPLIGEIAELMPQLLHAPLSYPEALSELWMGDRAEGLADLRDHYLRRLSRRGIAPGAVYVTDKMPLNEMHLGLISLLFADAPMVQVQRHPLDVVLSVFAQQLTHGFCCAFDLVSIALHYVLIADLMEHYRSELDRLPTPLRYEALVRAPEPELRRVLDEAGLALEPECLQVEANPRYAPTASYAQVTEPLYGRSVGRWRNYRTQLEPVMGLLAPVVARLGYAMD
jgi:Flp pilus assembly protein TadD